MLYKRLTREINFLLSTATILLVNFCLKFQFAYSFVKRFFKIKHCHDVYMFLFKCFSFFFKVRTYHLIVKFQVLNFITKDIYDIKGEFED